MVHDRPIRLEAGGALRYAETSAGAHILWTDLFRRLEILQPRLFAPDIGLLGEASPDWMAALGPGGHVWGRLRGLGWRSGRQIVLPLHERHIGATPDRCWALVPDAVALATLANKRAFARFAARHGLGRHIPRTLDLKAPSFPAVLKRLNLNAGTGIAVVTSQAELDDHLSRAPWLGQPVMLQRLIASRTEYVTHVVCAEGRIVWHCTYAYDLKGPRVIRGGRISQQPSPRHVSTAAGALDVFEQFLRPLGFNGPANIDYRHRRDGSIAILEINPRFGGSLMRPENADDLAAAVRTIVRHARWRPASVAVVPSVAPAV